MRLLARIVCAAVAGFALAQGSLPVAADACPPADTFGPLCLLGSAQWTEGAISALHVVGQLRNDGGTSLSGIQITVQLDTSNGPVSDTTQSSVLVLGPTELTPFEDIWFPIPTGYSGTFHITKLAYGQSTSQPAHSFLTTSIDPTACPTYASPTYICGFVTNTSGTITADNVRAILTFDDGAGHLAQDVIPVDDGTGSGTILPGHTSSFSRDLAYQPALPLAAKLAEPDYPIDLNPAALAFSGQVVGTSSMGHVTVTNNGPHTIKFNSVTATGDFTPTSHCGSSLASYSFCVIDVTFTPTVHGTRTGTLSVSDDAPGSAQSTGLSGTGTLPHATFSKLALAFGSLAVGATSPPQTTTLMNVGDGPMTIKSITTGPDFAQSNACPGVLTPGGQCDISVTFTPQKIGSLSETLTVQDDPVDTPDSVTLTGTGVGASVQLTPSALDFGPQQFGNPSSAQPIALTNSGNATLTITSITTTGDFAQTNNCGSSVAPNGSCTINVTFTPTALGPRSGSLNIADNVGGHSAGLTGTGTGRPAAIYRTVPTLGQYTLNGSDGQTWQDIDSANLVLTIPASTAPGMAILTANADLWTERAGVNQDIGIFVNGQLVAWKESGGFAGTFSPNAAAVQIAYALAPNTAYTVELRWKMNVASTARIHAGAGLGPFSPTILTAQVVNTLYGTQSTSQYTLTGSDGKTWQDIDSTALALTIPASPVNTTAILSGNADLWTEQAGVNQDIAIFVDGQLIAWKESGGFAGTFSPNAALVQITATLSPNRTHLVELRWKMNKSTTGHIRIGAGLGPFSPTTLTVAIAPTGTVTGVQSTDQYRLGGNDGQTWHDIDGTKLVTTGPASTTVVLSANADLWTEQAGINQDIGIFVDGQLVAWKESGGFAGTFSPNAAFVQIVVRLAPGSPHTIEVRWKTNVATTGGIRAGAGIGPSFSPTSLTVQQVPG